MNNALQGRSRLHLALVQPSFHASSSALGSHRVLGAARLSSSFSSYHPPSATAFRDGAWNIAQDTRWLHRMHSAWLLFGVCFCFPAIVGSSMRSIAYCEAPRQSHGKIVHDNFLVIGMPGDGRCLFRAVAYGLCTKQSKPTSNEKGQRELADELRAKAVDELIKRRKESEWFIEGDFDEYTRSMRHFHVWGGEPELLMLSHVLKSPITVYMPEERSNGLRAIAEYGQEYSMENPIRVLYHGFGHYDALVFTGEN